jgi:hypothetical protein
VPQSTRKRRPFVSSTRLHHQISVTNRLDQCNRIRCRGAISNRRFAGFLSVPEDLPPVSESACLALGVWYPLRCESHFHPSGDVIRWNSRPNLHGQKRSWPHKQAASDRWRSHGRIRLHVIVLLCVICVADANLCTANRYIPDRGNPTRFCGGRAFCKAPSEATRRRRSDVRIGFVLATTRENAVSCIFPVS